LGEAVPRVSRQQHGALRERRPDATGERGRALTRNIAPRQPRQPRQLIVRLLVYYNVVITIVV
jgi:hypothetical protein